MEAGHFPMARASHCKWPGMEPRHSEADQYRRPHGREEWPQGDALQSVYTWWLATFKRVILKGRVPLWRGTQTAVSRLVRHTLVLPGEGLLLMYPHFPDLFFSSLSALQSMPLALLLCTKTPCHPGLTFPLTDAKYCTCMRSRATQANHCKGCHLPWSSART